MSNHGSPVALPKLQMALKLILLMSSGSRKKEPGYMCLSEAKASHSQRMWAEVSSFTPHPLHSGLSSSPNRWIQGLKCSLCRKEQIHQLCHVGLKIHIFWNVTRCHWMRSSEHLSPRLDPEEEGTTVVWNVGNYPSTMQHHICEDLNFFFLFLSPPHICHPGVFLLTHIISLLSVIHAMYSIIQTSPCILVCIILYMVCMTDNKLIIS